MRRLRMLAFAWYRARNQYRRFGGRGDAFRDEERLLIIYWICISVIYTFSWRPGRDLKVCGTVKPGLGGHSFGVINFASGDILWYRAWL